MALSTSRGMAVGAYHLQVAKRNSSGYPVGQVADPETISNGTTMQPYLVRSLVSITPEERTYTTATNRGGMTVISQTTLGVDSLGTGSLVLSEYDETFLNFIRGTTLDTSTVDGFAMTASNIDQRNFPRLFIIGTQKFTDSIDGSDYYLNHVYTNAQIFHPSWVGLSQEGGVNPNPLTFTILPSKGTKNIDGRTLSASSGMYVVGASDTRVTIRSRYPLSFTSHKAASANTTYTLGYRPVYNTATGTADNSITKNGSTFAVSSVNTSTAVVTFTSGSDADFHVCVYQTEFVAV